eukprot:9389313-Pyramimonas_sp.AAC.2
MQHVPMSTSPWFSRSPVPSPLMSCDFAHQCCTTTAPKHCALNIVGHWVRSARRAFTESQGRLTRTSSTRNMRSLN